MNTGLLTKISAALYLFVEILQQHARAFLTMFCFAYRDAVLQTFKSPNDDTQSCMCKYVDAEEDAASFQEGKSRKQKKRDKKKEKKAASKWSQNERSKTTQCDDSSVGILPSNMTRKYEKKDPGFVLCGTLRLSLSSKLLHENTLTKPFDEAMNLFNTSFHGSMAVSRELRACAPAYNFNQNPSTKSNVSNEHSHRYFLTDPQNYARKSHKTAVKGTLEVFWCGGPGKASLELDGYLIHRWATSLENPIRVQVVSHLCTLDR